MSLDNIRLSQQERDQLVTFKRYSGIKQWNVLCRWALGLSLANPDPAPLLDLPSDSNVELSWRTFAGQHPDLYRAMMKQRCLDDGLDLEPATVERAFRSHLYRGIGYLAGERDRRRIDELIARALQVS